MNCVRTNRIAVSSKICQFKKRFIFRGPEIGVSELLGSTIRDTVAERKSKFTIPVPLSLDEYLTETNNYKLWTCHIIVFEVNGVYNVHLSITSDDIKDKYRLVKCTLQVPQFNDHRSRRSSSTASTSSSSSSSSPPTTIPLKDFAEFPCEIKINDGGAVISNVFYKEGLNPDNFIKLYLIFQYRVHTMETVAMNHLQK